MHNHSKSYSFISLILAACLGIFVSCSQNTPEIYNTDYSVIFDYTVEDKAPEARLSVFSSSGSDVRRYQRIKITSLDTGYCWDTEVITRLQEDDTQWVGCTNLVAPENEKLPSGFYELTFCNADEKEYTLRLDVKYDTDFYDVLLPALPQIMAEKRGIEKLAVYDKDHILIYFGDRTKDFNTTRDIWNQYREAETYQIIWYSRNGRVICITPEKPVTPEEND